MRLLCIRGTNLTSLSEPFTIDFETEPLRGAGLFAITGETGAGKSTLLDAICLALYGETPRLTGDGGREDMPDPSGRTIKATDARTLLRRGAAEGSAEVEFEGHDGRRYRARWIVRRARGRASGALQDFDRQLVRRGPGGDWEPVASGKTAVQGEIEALTDLTFDQFRRTALLAQGEFDAFIRAGESQRAELLEKITGTDVYARISQQVHEQAVLARQGVAALQASLDGVMLLSDADRSDLMSRRELADEQSRSIGVEIAALTEETERRRAVEIAGEARDKAQAEAAAAMALWIEAAPERDLRARLDKVAPLRPLFANLATAQADQQAARLAAEQATATLAVSKAALDSAVEAVEASAAALSEHQVAVKATEPEWAAAAALDTRIETAGRETARAKEALALATTAAASADRVVAAVEAALTAHGRRAGELAAQRARLAPITPFAPLWPSLRPRLGERMTLRESLAKDQAAATGKQGEITRLTRERDELAGRLAGAEAEATLLKAQITDRQAALDTLDERGVEDESRRLDALMSARGEARTNAAAYQKALERLSAAIADGIAAAALETVATTRLEHLQGDLEDHRQRRAAQQAGFDLADAVLDERTIALRSLLVEGEACPVCGSHDHPVTGHGDHLASLVAKLKAERAALDGAIAALEAAFADCRADIAAAGARRTAAEERRVRAEADRDEAARLYGALAGRLGDSPPSIETALVWLDTVEGELIERVRSLSARRDAIAPLRDALSSLRKRQDGLASLVAAERPELDRTVETLTATRLDLATTEQKMVQAHDRLAAIDTDLADLLRAADLSIADLDRDAITALARLDDAFGRLKALDAEEASLVPIQADLERRRNEATAALSAAHQAVETARVALEERTADLDRLILERSELLGGMATDAHRRHATALLEQAAARHEKAMAAKAEAGSALAKATAEDQAARRTNEAMESRCETIAGSIEAARAKTNLSDEAIDEALTRGPDEIAAIIERLDRIERARQTTSALLAAALQRQTEAEAAAAGARSIEVLATEIQSANERKGDLDRTVGVMDGQLAMDEQARDRAQGIVAAIAQAQARQRTVAAVDEAIGSADGNKFRRFAQSLTLDRLILLANVQLAALAPRYRLQRAEIGGLGLHIVDRDMGGEIRSTRSLSGGERFLASLALALALSGLEGRRSFVDTLFIDEGFGALDAGTLDVAIDALEALQGQGRRIGVISHVAAMIERISVQIRVEKSGSGRSIVRTDFAAAR